MHSTAFVLTACVLALLFLGRLCAAEDAETLVFNTEPSSDWWATLTAEYDPIQFMPESTSPNLGRRGMNESWWTVERERVRKMGLHGMRLWFQIDWWQPFDDPADPKRPVTDYAAFDVDGPRMQSVYRFLDACQQYGIEVQLNFGWKLDLPARYWLAPPNQLGRPNPDIKDAEAHARSLVALLKYLREVRKYTVVTHVSLGNEFEYNYPDLYPAMHRRLVSEGLRKDYVLVALESNAGIQRSHDLAAAHPEVFDVHSLHVYDTMDLGSRLVKDFAALKDLEAKGAGPRTFGTRGRVFYTEFALGPSKGLDIARAVIGSAREGAYGAGGWRLGDQHLTSVCDHGHGSDRFDHGLHQWGAWEWIPWMKRPRESYFATSLLTRYTQRGSRIFLPAQRQGLGQRGTGVPPVDMGKMPMPQRGTGVPPVDMDKTPMPQRGAGVPPVDMGKMPMPQCVCFEKNGEYTIVALNDSAAAQAVRIRLPQPVKKVFRRHLFEAKSFPKENYDTVIPSDKQFAGPSLDDLLPPGSFALYTTLPDWPQLELSPYVSVIKPGDAVQLAAKRIACDGELRWSVDGGGANGTVSADGLYRAPKDPPAIDPVIVRATCAADERPAGLAILSFSGQPTDPPSRPSVSIVPKVGGGSSRMADLGTNVPLDTSRKLAFRMTNHGPAPASYTIVSTAPWLTVTPNSGEIAPNQAQTVEAQAAVDTHGLAPGRWYRGYLRISSPRGLGEEILDVFFKSATK